MFLSGTGLAAGIAWINSLGNLGGFFGPWYVGLMKDWTASFSGGLYGLALTTLVSRAARRRRRQWLPSVRAPVSAYAQGQSRTMK